MRKLCFLTLIILVCIALIACVNNSRSGLKNNQNSSKLKDATKMLKDKKEWEESAQITEEDSGTLILVDDWAYDPNRSTETEISGHNSLLAEPPHVVSGALSHDFYDSSLGFSVGGAKDISNFRENIKQGYMPVKEDITHEGLFSDYFFDNNITKPAQHLFEPTYTSYKKRDPLTNEEETYLSVGLNSNISESSFKRKKLNLTIVLDISGSMSSSFDEYYYNRNRHLADNTYNSEEEEAVKLDNRTKMEIAKECVIDLTKHLKKDDRLAMVLFDHAAYLAKPFRKVGATDMKAIHSHISEVKAVGGTNMYVGLYTASELYDDLPEYDSTEYDNRIIFLTDAMPNTHVTSENTIWGMMKVNAEKKVYTTFVGIGVDLNSEMINHITKTPGANYYAVHNAQEFKQRMDTQFEYMVTPLVFDLTLHLESRNYDIEAVYGSPEANQATGEIMKVNTLFPSESKDSQARGGIIILKLKKRGSGADISLTVSYKDREGIPYTVAEKVKLTDSMIGTDNGVRKAILLSQYVNLIHEWLNAETSAETSEGENEWQYEQLPPPGFHYPYNPRTKWERNSELLVVSALFSKQFKEFRKYFAQEATQIADPELRQELDLLDILVDVKNQK